MLSANRTNVSVIQDSNPGHSVSLTFSLQFCDTSDELWSDKKMPDVGNIKILYDICLAVTRTGHVPDQSRWSRVMGACTPVQTKNGRTIIIYAK